MSSNDVFKLGHALVISKDNH